MHGHFLARRDGILDFLGHPSAEGELGKGDGGILLGNGVNLLALARRDGNRFHRADGLRTVGEGGVLNVTVFVSIAAFRLVDPEGFRGGVFQGAKLVGGIGDLVIFYASGHVL